MFKFIGFLALATIVAANDLTVGHKDEGRKIIDEQRIASPAIWRQTANVTYNVSDSEVISRVVVTDLRPDKDGEAKIVEGGEGYKNVTIELKSPTMLRGYDFVIQVYAVSEDNIPISTTVKSDLGVTNKQDTVSEHNKPISTTEQSDLGVTNKQDTPNVPISLSGETLEDNLRKTRKTVDADSSTLKVDITTEAPTNPTQVANDQSTLKAVNAEESKKEAVQTPINIGKDVKGVLEASTTPIITSTTVTLPSEASVQSEVNKPEVNKSDPKKNDAEELKPVIPNSFVHEQFRNTRNSKVPAVEDNDDTMLTTGQPELETSTEVSSTVEADSTTVQPSSDIVTVIDTLEALASKKDVTEESRILLSKDSERNGHRFEVPIPYNH